MKKNLFILSVFVLFCASLKSQSTFDKFTTLTSAIHKINPDIDFADKLVFVSVWKSTDFESREINKEAYRVYKIYKAAKLKNGEKGVVFISLNVDENSQNKDIALKKDELPNEILFIDKKLKDILLTDFNFSATQHTLVFDKTGSIQYTDIATDQIFPSFRNLTIR